MVSGQSDPIPNPQSPIPPSNTIVYERDSAGRIVSESDNVSSVTYVYSDAGKIISTTQSSILGPVVTLAYQYDTIGRLAQMYATIDGTPDFVDDYAYDSLGRIIAVTRHNASLSPLPPEAGPIEEYNAVANVQIALAYDDAGQLVSIDRYLDSQLAVEGDYSYDTYGRLVGLLYHQGDTVLNSYGWTYSESGQSSVVSGQYDSSLSTTHYSLSTAWLPTGGLLPIHDTSGVTAALMSGGLSGLDLLTGCTSIDGTANYSYDATGQLIGAQYSPRPLAGEGQGVRAGESLSDESYTYDANGNRVTANGSVYATGLDNRLLSDGVYRYEYDAEGNCVARYVDVDEDGLLSTNDTNITKYGWDARNRLTEVSHYATYASLSGQSPDMAVDYLYDVENRWIGEDIDLDGDGQIDRLTRFAYDGNQIVLEFDRSLPSISGGGAGGEGSSGQGAGSVTATALTVSDLSHRYLWQPDVVDQLLTDEQLLPSPACGRGAGGEGGTVVLPLGDNLGTIRDLAGTDAETGVTTVANHRVYDTYGNLKSQTNAAVDCLFGFTGRPFDNSTGVNMSQTRPYEASTGRWLGEDWMTFYGRDTNTSRYCGNSPTNATDPTGFTSVPLTTAQAREIVNNILECAQATSGSPSKRKPVGFKFISAHFSNQTPGETDPGSISGVADGVTISASLSEDMKIIKRICNGGLEKRSVAVLEFIGHGAERGGLTLGVKSYDDLPDSKPVEYYLNTANAVEFALELKRQVSFSNPAVIILVACNLGNFTKTENNVAQIVADQTGLPVLSPGGYACGGLFKDGGVPSARYRDDRQTFHARVDEKIANLESDLKLSPNDAALMAKIKKWKEIKENTYESEDDRWYLTIPYNFIG